MWPVFILIESLIFIRFSLSFRGPSVRGGGGGGGGNYPGGNYPGGNYPGGQLSGGETIRWGNYPGGQLSGHHFCFSSLKRYINLKLLA